MSNSFFSHIKKRAAFELWMQIHQSPSALMRVWQLWRTQRIVAIAYTHVPMYRKLMDDTGIVPAGIRKFSDIQKLPVINKQFLQKQQWEDSTHSILRNFQNSYRMALTSGSTGEPFSFPQSTNAFLHPGYSAKPLRANPLLFRFLFWQGHSFEDIYEKMRVAGIRIYNLPCVKNYLYIPVRMLHDDDNGLLEKITYFRPDILEGRTSVLVEFARLLKEHGEKMKLPFIITHGETINNAQLEYFEKMLGSKPYSRYSLEEVPDVAIDCALHTGLHVHEESLLLEILDNADKPVAPGVPGRLVITHFENEIMPFIRYDTGDVGMIVPGICPCGIRARRIKIHTRKQGGFVAIGNKKYHISEFEAFFDEFADFVLQFQIVKRNEKIIEIRILPTLRYSRIHEEELKNKFREYFKTDTIIRLVKSIRYEGEEKARFIIDETAFSR
ncbi:MAG: hypothetical protein A3A28_04385 [Candidatus Sungbacteria bacterium RIFCSPLOWO2_01_FULL_47_32]|nr:MAG: hypothetical protein A3D57_00875 [Candidatus Sungbacteria bacterium RIFCSPHIGHO2_02_FULL_46_12]OHA05653.1 MAG: hypothetical protein A3A28_04385 [Candidatus Sungbacteria bacterium RIFCSPLOWO2_01_FULL_47_32]